MNQARALQSLKGEGPGFSAAGRALWLLNMLLILPFLLLLLLLLLAAPQDRCVVPRPVPAVSVQGGAGGAAAAAGKQGRRKAERAGERAQTDELPHGSPLSVLACEAYFNSVLYLHCRQSADMYAPALSCLSILYFGNLSPTCNDCGKPPQCCVQPHSVWLSCAAVSKF
jgi:hypothetical protein